MSDVADSMATGTASGDGHAPGRTGIRRDLVWMLAKQAFLQRYRGSYLGVLWCLLVPIVMMAAYTFVFSGVFKARWGASERGPVFYALNLFCGLVPFQIFAEVICGTPSAIVGHANYVKKVVFPLEVIPVACLVSALLTGAAQFVVLVAATVFMKATGLCVLPDWPTWRLVFVPLSLVPLTLLSLGLGWFLSALGVFLRDITTFTGILAQLVMFLSPIFYPIQAVPESVQKWIWLNPMTSIVTTLRGALLLNESPPWTALGITSGAALAVMVLGHLFFARTRAAFADVI